MKTMKMVLVLAMVVMCAATVSAQIDLPFDQYGEKVEVVYPNSFWLRLNYDSEFSTVSRDGLLFAQPGLSVGGGGESIYMASYPNMVLSEIMRLEDITFEYPAKNISSLLFHPDNVHIFYTTTIYDPERGGVYIETEHGTSTSNGLATICMLNTQTGEHQVLIEGGAPKDVSPDGRYLLYVVQDFRRYTTPEAAVDDRAWALYDFETGESTLLRDMLDDDFGRSVRAITFAADGTSLYYLKGIGTGNYSTCGCQLYKASLDGSSIIQLSSFEYPNDESWDYWVKLLTLALSPDGKWAVFTGSKMYGVPYLLMYELASGRIWSLYTGEEITDDFQEMIEYEDNIIDTYVDISGNSYYQSGYGNTYTINGVEYDYDQFHLVYPSFVGWHPDGETLVMYCSEIRGGGIYYKSFDPAFYKDSVTFVENDTPEAFATLANYPNPFNPLTTLSFTVPVGGYTELYIYNLAGQKVRELVAGTFAPGSHEVVWDGRDDHGNPVSSGVFVSRLKTGDTVVTNRMTLVK